MTGTDTSGHRLSRILKVIVITLGGLAALVAVLFLLRSALGLYAYRAQGFPLPVKDFMSNDSISVPGFLASPSTDTTPVLITLNHTTKLHIPRNYLFDAAITNPYPDLNLQIITTYPAFQGVDETTIDKARTQQWYDADNVIVIHRITSFSAEELRANHKTALDKIARDIGPLETNPQTPPGFLTTYVKYRGSLETSLLIDCPGHHGPWTNTEFCQVYVAVAPSFVVMYQFRPPLLPHWQAIDDNVMKLLNSFVEK